MAQIYLRIRFCNLTRFELMSCFTKKTASHRRGLFTYDILLATQFYSFLTLLWELICFRSCCLRFINLIVFLINQFLVTFRTSKSKKFVLQEECFHLIEMGGGSLVIMFCWVRAYNLRSIKEKSLSKVRQTLQSSCAFQ